MSSKQQAIYDHREIRFRSVWRQIPVGQIPISSSVSSAATVQTPPSGCVLPKSMSIFGSCFAISFIADAAGSLGPETLPLLINTPAVGFALWRVPTTETSEASEPE